MRPIRCLNCETLLGVHWDFDERTERHVRRFVNGAAQPIERCPGCGHDLGHLADCQQLKVLPGKLEVQEQGSLGKSGYSPRSDGASYEAA